MFKKRILLIVIIIITAITLVACESKSSYQHIYDKEYKATMYSDANAWFINEFLIENLTRNSIYDNGEREINTTNDAYPKFLTYIIKSQEAFDSKFKEFPPTVDFEKEMLLLYIFTSTSPNPYEIIKISLEGDVLKVDFKEKRTSGIKDNLTRPQQKCLVVKMDKMDIISVEFNKF